MSYLLCSSNTNEQCAFGEVYQGFDNKTPSGPLDMAVAVKRLPELSSNQAELNFLIRTQFGQSFYRHSHL